MDELNSSVAYYSPFLRAQCLFSLPLRALNRSMCGLTLANRVFRAGGIVPCEVDGVELG